MPRRPTTAEFEASSPVQDDRYGSCACGEFVFPDSWVYNGVWHNRCVQGHLVNSGEKAEPGFEKFETKEG